MSLSSTPNIRAAVNSSNTNTSVWSPQPVRLGKAQYGASPTVHVTDFNGYDDVVDANGGEHGKHDEADAEAELAAENARLRAELARESSFDASDLPSPSSAPAVGMGGVPFAPGLSPATRRRNMAKIGRSASPPPLASASSGSAAAAAASNQRSSSPLATGGGNWAPGVTPKGRAAAALRSGRPTPGSGRNSPLGGSEPSAESSVDAGFHVNETQDYGEFDVLAGVLATAAEPAPTLTPPEVETAVHAAAEEMDDARIAQLEAHAAAGLAAQRAADAAAEAAEEVEVRATEARKELLAKEDAASEKRRGRMLEKAVERQQQAEEEHQLLEKLRKQEKQEFAAAAENLVEDLVANQGHQELINLADKLATTRVQSAKQRAHKDALLGQLNQSDLSQRSMISSLQLESEKSSASRAKLEVETSTLRGQLHRSHAQLMERSEQLEALTTKLTQIVGEAEWCRAAADRSTAAQQAELAVNTTLKATLKSTEKQLVDARATLNKERAEQLALHKDLAEKVAKVHAETKDSLGARNCAEAGLVVLQAEHERSQAAREEQANRVTALTSQMLELAACLI